MTLPDRVSTDVAIQVATAWRDADREKLRAEVERLREMLTLAKEQVEFAARQARQHERFNAARNHEEALVRIRVALDEDQRRGDA